MTSQNKQSQGGFTMLEMMIVMAILSVLIYAGASVIVSLQSQGRIDLTLEELKEMTTLGEQARLLPGGKNYTRVGTAQVAQLIVAAGGNPGGVSTVVDRLNPDDNPYLITTLNMRSAVVETDLDEPNLSLFGVNSQTIGTTSRLRANYKPHFSSPQVKTSLWNKKIWYCEDYLPTNKPSHCP